MNLSNEPPNKLEDPVHIPLVVLLLSLLLLHWLLCLHGPATPPGRGVVLEHALPVIAKHPLQRTGHGVSPEEVVVEGIVSI